MKMTAGLQERIQGPADYLVVNTQAALKKG